MEWLWWMRWIVLAMSGFLAGTTAVIATRYAVIWSRVPAEQKSQHRGLLPLHVWLVTLSYDLLLASATVEVWTRMTVAAGPSWRVFVLLPAYVLGVLAMIVIYRRRVSGRLENS